MEAHTAAEAGAEARANPDLELAERHRYGDVTAFEELYQRHVTMVYNLCGRLARDLDEAEDLTQEIFLRIYRHLGRFDGRSSLKTWIYQVSLNYCRSRLSRRRFWPVSLTEHEGEGTQELVEERRGPEQLALAEDAGRRVRAALRELKPVFRDAVVLRDLEGLSYEEIAAVLRLPVGTVRSRIARGRENLRLALEKSS